MYKGDFLSNKAHEFLASVPSGGPFEYPCGYLGVPLLLLFSLCNYDSWRRPWGPAGKSRSPNPDSQSAMAPKTRAKSKPPATEAAAAAASPSAPRAKRGRAAAAAATLPQASEEEANHLAQGGATQGAFEALQQEMVIMRRELADLRQPPETTLAPPLRHSQQSGAEPVSPSLTPPPPAPILRGDPSSP